MIGKYKTDMLCRDISKISYSLFYRALSKSYFELSYCRINNLVEKDITKRQTYLKKLTGIGVLERSVSRQRKAFCSSKTDATHDTRWQRRECL